MSDFLSGITLGALGGIVFYRIAIRFSLSRKAKKAAPAPAVVEIVASDAATPLDEPEDVETVLRRLSKGLSPLAGQIDHPRELPAMPELQVVVAALRRSDATFALLSQYALGLNWPLACAAFIVAAERPERHFLCEPTLRQLESTRPYVLMYAFKFLPTLQRRPPVGAAILGVPEWWQNNPVIPGFFQDYFTRSAEMGDRPVFGDRLAGKPGLAVAPINGLLNKIQHPFATSLAAELRAWEETRIDRSFLNTVGALWNPADRDPLLVSPPAWRELLTAAESAIRQPRARSVLISGDPRIGKSAMVRLLGGALQEAGWTIFSASGAELMADQIYFGQLEGRIRKIVESLHSRRKLVWNVSDLGQMANSGTHKGQAASILDQILPAIVAGNLIIIGEVSRKVATRLFQSRPSLRSVIEVLPLEPMDESETLALAGQVGQRIAGHFKIEVSDQAIVTPMELAQHYLGGGPLPGIVLELLRRARSTPGKKP